MAKKSASTPPAEEGIDNVAIDPMDVIASLSRQNTEQTMQIAKLEAVAIRYRKERDQLQEMLASQVPKKDHAKVKHEGRTTESSKKKKTKTKHKEK